MKYEWKSIEPLSEADKSTDLADVDSLKSAWDEVRTKLAQSSAENLKDFNERLARQWSIETGILERIYDLDRGTTLVLIEHGFLANLVDRNSTNKDPEQLIQILRDHKAAVDLVHDCVGNLRPLTIGLIHELHSILTRHQNTVEGLDQFENLVSYPLIRGTYKVLPNNPKRPDGTVHEYCPPVHVASEMNNLLGWYNEYQEINPILLASWLHHRFTQIHPYQDGNGRVARALANLVFIKNEMFPVVITRDHRSKYIEALENADSGNLGTLTRLLAEIEKKTILEAISIAPDKKPSVTVVSEVADAIGAKLRRRREEVTQRLRGVNDIAEQLQDLAYQHMRTLAQNVKSRINESADLNIKMQVLLGGPGKLHNGLPTEHWYHFQVAKTARETKHRINFDENHYFVRTRLSADGVPWLTFVISFHHIGQELSGVMETTTFAEITYPASEEDPSRIDQIDCMDKPFAFTFKDNFNSVQNKFIDWLNETFTIAVSNWGEVL